MHTHIPNLQNEKGDNKEDKKEGKRNKRKGKQNIPVIDMINQFNLLTLTMHWVLISVYDPCIPVQLVWVYPSLKLLE